MELSKIQSLLSEGESIYNIPLRVTFYARVSTEKEAQLNSLDNQVTYYKDFIQKNPKWIYVDGYVDEGISGGSTRKREYFLDMIEAGKAGKFDLVLTKEISRFARNTLDSILYTRELLKHGVGVFFQMDNINTLMPDSELRLTIMASLAQDDIRRLSERLKFGYQQAIKKGRVLGQNNITGYDKRDGKLYINEEEAEIVRFIFHTYIQGRYGLRRIARELEKRGIVSSTGKMLCYGTLLSILKNPKYKGYYCGRKSVSIDYLEHKSKKLKESEWVMYKDPNIPAIVSEEVWDKANRLLKERGKKFSERAAAYSTRYTYSGKLFCSEHNVSYHRHVYPSRSGDKEVWNCGIYRLKGRIEGCDSPTIYTSELNYIMSMIYKMLYDNREEVIEGLFNIYKSLNDSTDYQSEISRIQGRIASIEKKKDKLLELSVEGVIDKFEFAERNNRFNAEIEKLRQRILAIQEQYESLLDTRNRFDELKYVLKREWGDKDIEEFTSIVLDRIIVKKLNSKRHVELDILLRTGQRLMVEYQKFRNQAIPEHSISLQEIGITSHKMLQFKRANSGLGKRPYVFTYSIDVKIAI